MSNFWEFVNSEEAVVQKSYADLKEVTDLAVDAWNAYITPSYFTNFKVKSSASIIYKTQADVALKQAITSVLKKQYAQALYNVRFADENLVIAIYGYAEPDKVLDEMKKRQSVDKTIRGKANAYLATKLPDNSLKFKNLHKTCDRYGSHQSVSHVGRNFRFRDDSNGFEILMVGEDNLQLNIGIMGIVIGLIIEFYFSISKLPEVEWIKVSPDTSSNMEAILVRFEAMKTQYRSLWGDLI